MGLIPKHLCKACHTYSMHAQMHLMTPQGHLVHLAMVYSQFSHLCGIIIIFKIIFLSFYLNILGLLDNTSQRKLAHIQRLILLNYYFNSITDITVSTLFPWQYATGQYYWSQINFILFLYFFRHSC